MAKYTTDELRAIAKSKEPHNWGGKSQALLYAADVIDAANALINEQQAKLDAKDKELAALREYATDYFDDLINDTSYRSAEKEIAYQSYVARLKFSKSSLILEWDVIVKITIILRIVIIGWCWLVFLLTAT